ncbi:hypothetical protein BE11_49395 [Sorangium cellulosum]|nr:hypothetical protein BE11_49395 [Sorangium cellulosum]
MQEETLYSDKETTVTPTRFVVGKTTYAINQITSVTAAAAPRNPVTLAMGLGLFFVGVYVLASTDAVGMGIMALAMGVLFSLAFIPRRHVVAIGTSSGQVQAVVSPDPAKVQRIADALSLAITSRR